MSRRAAAALGAALLLAGCQPPGYDITLSSRDGALVLEAAGSDIWPFAWSDDTIDAGAIEIVDGRRVIWRVVAGPRCSRRRVNPFPVTIGTTPACFVEEVPFGGLGVNTLYRVTGEGLRRGDGYFSIRPRISNHSWDEVQGEVRAWPPEGHADPAQPEDDAR